MSALFLSEAELEKMEIRVQSYSMVTRRGITMQHDLLILIQACKILLADNRELLVILQEGVMMTKEDFEELQTLMLTKLADLTPVKENEEELEIIS